MSLLMGGGTVSTPARKGSAVVFTAERDSRHMMLAAVGLLSEGRKEVGRRGVERRGGAWSYLLSAALPGRGGAPERSCS